MPEQLTRYKSELNEEQFRVVTAQPKATLVVAGAGTGKTRAITYRVAYLIEQGVSPQRILLATFTNRASREMLRRVETLTGSQNVHRVWGGTFHRIANLILRRHAVSIGFDSNYSILDSEDARDFINVCIEDAAIDTKAKRFPKADLIQSIISYANNTDLPIENVIVGKYPYFEMLTAQIKRIDSIYQTRKRERNVMDYDDLLLNVKLLLIQGSESDELLTLTSVHQAKGLEWKAVFIIWAAEGKFPSPRSLKEIDSEEEERRLWYVALTRAKDELYITYPLILTDYNRQSVLQKPSRFVTECPPALFEIWDLEEESSLTQTNALAVGGSDEFIN